MKLRIVSNGTARGTRVETESGERVEGVEAVYWEITEPSAMGRATIIVKRVSLDGQAEYGCLTKALGGCEASAE